MYEASISQQDARRYPARPILGVGAGTDFIEGAGVPAALVNGQPDPGLLLFSKGHARDAIPQFVKAIARHRHPEREMDPPEV